MKIVVPTNGNDLDSVICKSFGRAKRFLVVDLETSEFDVVENTQNYEASQGAGIQSAQSAIKAGADTIITVHCGPKAYKVLLESGVKIYEGAEGTVIANVEEYKHGTLGIMKCANVESHWV